MVMNRILVLAATSVLMAGWMTVAHGQRQAPSGYPNRPIRLLIGLPAGGAIDVFMRDFGQRLTERWGQSFIIDNRPGASGLIAMDAVAKAPPDGYTLLAGTNIVVTNMLLGKVPYDIRKVFAPIIRLTSQPYLLIANNQLPANSMSELIAVAKSKPGTLNYASSGVGAASHLGMELLKYMAGVDIVHVPYKGIPQGITDMLSGRIDMIFSITITAVPLIKSGKVKVLGVTTVQRSQLLPDVPTIAESGVSGFSLSTDYSLFAPAGTPADISDLINRASAQVMASPEMKKRLEADGSEAAPPNTPAEFRKTIDQDIVQLEKFIKASGYKAD